MHHHSESNAPAQELVRSLLPGRSDGMRFSVLAVMRNNTLQPLLYLSGEPVHGRVSGWEGASRWLGVGGWVGGWVIRWQGVSGRAWVRWWAAEGC
jgi:hypothetical protein